MMAQWQAQGTHASGSVNEKLSQMLSYAEKLTLIIMIVLIICP